MMAYRAWEVQCRDCGGFVRRAPGTNILYPQCMLFPGFPGVATAVGLFALIWLFIYLKSKGKPVVFDPGGKHGEFGKRLLPMYLDITKFVLGLSAGSIVLLVGSLNFQSVKWPVSKALRVAFVSGGDEHHLRSAFHDLAGVELRISFTPS